jgi:hypothetical protein
MILVGVVSGTIIPSVDLLPILGKRIHIQGSNLRAQKATYQTDLISRSFALSFSFFFFFCLLDVIQLRERNPVTYHWRRWLGSDQNQHPQRMSSTSLIS